MLSFIWPKLKVNQELHVLQASERDMEKSWTLEGPWCCILMKFHRSFIKMLQDYRKRHGGKMESWLKPQVYHEPPYPPRLQEETWLGVWICFINFDLNQTFTEKYSHMNVFQYSRMRLIRCKKPKSMFMSSIGSVNYTIYKLCEAQPWSLRRRAPIISS